MAISLDGFMASTDRVGMGSGAFRTAQTFADWPPEKPVIVLNKTMKQ